MKKIILIAATMLFIVSATGYAAPPAKESKEHNGRYQLFQGKHETIFANKAGETSSVKEESLFKIDTESGDTWIFFEIVSNKDGVRRFWVPIKEEANP